VLVIAEERARLAAIAGDRSRPLKHVRRARIVLHSADRPSVVEVARRASVGRPADPAHLGGAPAAPPPTANLQALQGRGEKVEDILAPDMHRPAHAIGRCREQNSPIHFLDRTQPGLPLKPGKCGTMTHD
jgi:hypothetical protein